MKQACRRFVVLAAVLILASCTLLSDLSRKKSGGPAAPEVVNIVHIEAPWARSFGGTGSDSGICVIADQYSRLFLAGNFTGIVNFNPATNPQDTNSTNYSFLDAYLSRYDCSGNYYWTRTFGGNDENFPYGVALSSSGDCYLTGAFSGTVDFDTGSNTNMIASGGNYDVFITKFDISGNWIWTRTFGSLNAEYGRAISTDPSDNVFVTGTFSSNCDFDPSAGVDMKAPSAPNSSDVFLVKLKADGSYAWSIVCGGAGDEQVTGLSVDSDGNAYISGFFNGTADFDPSGGVDNRTAVGDYDCFLLKIMANGSYGWVKTFGGAGEDVIRSVASDRDNNVYVAGYYNATVDFDPSAGVNNLTSAGGADVFVSKFQSNGNYIWTDSFGGTGDERGMGVTTDISNNVYVAGYFSGTCDFDPSAGINNIAVIGGYDAFLSQFRQDGSYSWTKQFGGLASEYGLSVSCNRGGNVFMTGYFSGTCDFDPTTASSNITSKGALDVFLVNSTW